MSEISVAVLLFNEVEILDFAGPFEVFSTAARIPDKEDTGDESAFNVFTVTGSAAPAITRGGLEVRASYTIWDHPSIDVLIVPGGVVDEPLGKPAVLNWIRTVAQDARLTASVCTGAFLLAEAGLLHQLSATTHWDDIEAFARRYPQVDVQRNKRWVDNGTVVTSAGISAGIDMSLHLVARLKGMEAARLTARQMDYRWIDTAD